VFHTNNLLYIELYIVSLFSFIWSMGKLLL